MKFHHRIPGAKFFLDDGKEISFAGGEFDTEMVKDAVLRAKVELELRKVADVASSQIYTKNPVISPEEKDVAGEIANTATVGFDADRKIPAGATTIAMPVPKALVPALNPALAAAAEVSGGGSLAAAMEQAKKAVAKKG